MARMPKAQYQIVADDRTRTGFESAQRRMRDLTSQAKALALPVAALGAAFAAAAAKAVSMGDAIDKAARTAGVSTKRIQELRFAFGQLAGATARDVDMALQRFNKRFGQAQEGSREYAKVLEELGVQLSLDTPRALEATLLALSQIESDSERAAAAARVFGDEAGPKLSGALDGGIGSLERLAAQLRADGGIVSDEAITNATRLNDAFDRLQTRLESNLNNLLLENADAIATVAENAGDAIDDVRGFTAEMKSLWTTLRTEYDRLPPWIREGLERGVGTFTSNPFGEGSPARISTWQEMLGGGGGGSLSPESLGLNVPSPFGVPNEPLIFAPGGGETKLPPPFDFSQEDIDLHREMVMEAEAEEMGREAAARERREADARQHMQRMVALEERAARERASIEERLQAQKGAMLQQGLSTFGNIATALTAESKHAALYSLAISKAIGVASVLIDGHRAAGRALAELGPIAGPPVAAKFLAASKASAGFIAAMGLAEGAAMSLAPGGGSGGGGGGGGGGFGFGSGQPVTGQSAALGVQERDTNAAAVTVRLTVDGSSAANANVIRAMADGLRAEIEEGDAVLISRSSRQAAEIRGGR